MGDAYHDPGDPARGGKVLEQDVAGEFAEDVGDEEAGACVSGERSQEVDGKTHRATTTL